MTDVPTLLTNVAVGVSAGGTYGILWYAEKHKTNGEEFDPAKFGGTLIVAAAIGATLGLSGVEVTEETLVPMLTANTALIALLEPVLKTLADSLGVFENYY